MMVVVETSATNIDWDGGKNARVSIEKGKRG